MGRSLLNNIVLFFVIALFLTIGFSSEAKVISLGESSVNVMGYVTQATSFQYGGDDYFTEEGFQSAIMTLFLEGIYQPSDRFTLYGATKLGVDWIYDLKHNDDSWTDKKFNESRDTYYLQDEFWQVLHEFHASWTLGNYETGQLYLRLGKQIVGWGEMDSTRILDQINPLDSAYGIGDVEFETTIIPIWLLRADYTPNLYLSWLQDLEFQFVFNPNADFIPDRGLEPGNDAGGVWAPEARIFTGAPFPFDKIYLGSFVSDVSEPDEFDSDFFEYGLRIRGIISGWSFSLNGFYGRANSPVTRYVPPYEVWSTAYDGRSVLGLVEEGYYPRQKFVGMSLNKELSKVQITALGGVAPVMRIESMYEFDSTLTNAYMEFVESDRFSIGVGFDWKFKLRFLPQRAFFELVPQIIYQKYLDYPDVGVKDNAYEEDRWETAIFLSTKYMNARLHPYLVYIYEHEFDSNLWILKLTYTWNAKWETTIGATILDGNESEANGLDAFKNKDQVTFKIRYQFN
jgi:uncharacterized protein DUF1302